MLGPVNRYQSYRLNSSTKDIELPNDLLDRIKAELNKQIRYLAV